MLGPQPSSCRTGGSAYSYAPSLPPHSPVKAPASPKATIIPGSLPRKVVTDFAVFGAPANASVFGTAVASTPFSLAGGKAAFGGIRTRGARSTWDGDDDDDDGGRQRVFHASQPRSPWITAPSKTCERGLCFLCNPPVCKDTFPMI